jgi:hypothetical protein
MGQWNFAWPVVTPVFYQCSDSLGFSRKVVVMGVFANDQCGLDIRQSLQQFRAPDYSAFWPWRQVS